MSEADKLFEDLGYGKEEKKHKTLGKIYKYENKEINRIIEFILKFKEVEICNAGIDMPELEAINKKCKELWGLE